MKEVFNRGLSFVKDNLTIISSIALIFIVIGALFLNAYLSIYRFQENQDLTLRSKAMLAENIVNIAALDYFSSRSQLTELQNKLVEIQRQESELTEITLFGYESSKKDYLPIYESNPSKQTQIEDDAKKFSISVNNAFAYLSNESNIRFWNVMKAVRDNEGNVQGIIKIKMSLSKSDELVRQTINQVYTFSTVAAFLVLLLIINHIRLFGYEVKAKKLEEIDRMKDDFISMASHDLKSPLTAIRGYSEMLNDILNQPARAETFKQQKKYLRNIDMAADRLKNLVEDLLDVSRIEQNRLPVNCKPIEINEIINTILLEMKILADQKKLELKNSLPFFSKIVADPERIKQIIVNLVNNAIKYTPHGSIELLGKEDNQWVYITIADTGIGISPDNLQKLFSKFFRVRNSQTLQISGTGLGLWIVKEVTEKMGGELIVESIEGVGSHFTVKFKKA